MEPSDLAWYCARTKPKHEHIAAANIRKSLGLEIFHPRLAVERATRRGPVKLVEPLFPGYLFVRCVLEKSLSDLQYTNGISSLVRFGSRIPPVADSVIAGLAGYFAEGEPIEVKDRIAPADEVTVVDGAFAGMNALVLRVLPARRRVQILLDVLGRPTQVEVARSSVELMGDGLAGRLPALAASV